MTRLSNDLTDMFVIAMFVLGLLFIARYTWVAPWWKHLVGKAMVSLDFANVLILFSSFIVIVFHVKFNTPFFAWYRVVSLGIGTGVIAWRTWTVGHVNAQVTAPEAPAEQPPADPSLPEEAHDAVCPE